MSLAGDGDPRKVPEQGRFTHRLITKTPLGWRGTLPAAECLCYGAGLCPPTCGSPVPPSLRCLLSWLDIAGSSAGPRGPGVATHHFPSPVCVSHQLSDLGMIQSQTPKTGASLAGRPGFRQVGEMLGVNGGNRGRVIGAEAAWVAVLATPGEQLRPDPRARGGGLGWQEGGEAGTREQEKRTYWGACEGNGHCPARGHCLRAAQWMWHMEPGTLVIIPRSHCPCHTLSQSSLVRRSLPNHQSHLLVATLLLSVTPPRVHVAGLAR